MIIHFVDGERESETDFHHVNSLLSAMQIVLFHDDSWVRVFTLCLPFSFSRVFYLFSALSHNTNYINNNQTLHILIGREIFYFLDDAYAFYVHLKIMRK